MKKCLHLKRPKKTKRTPGAAFTAPKLKRFRDAPSRRLAPMDGAAMALAAAMMLPRLK